MSYAGKAGDNYLIAINGARSYQANFDSFETDFEALRSQFPNIQRRIFSAEGKSAKFLNIELTPLGVLTRDITGRVKYSSARFSDSEAAYKANIASAVSSISSKKPAKVTIVYGNHGLPEGPSSLDGIITRKEIEGHSNKLPSTSIVQRIHLHCYSGSMFELNEQGKPLNEIKYLHELKKFFKPNRCGLADATEDQLSSTYNGISDYLRKKPKANLQDLYKHLLFAERDSDPILTSKLFLRAFAQVECSKLSSLEASVCIRGNDCNYGDSVKKGQICKDFESLSDISSPVDTKRGLIGMINFYNAMQSSILSDYIKKNHRDLYKNYLHAQERYQNYLMCINLGVMKSAADCPKDLKKAYEQIVPILKEYEALEAKYGSSNKIQQILKRQFRDEMIKNEDDRQFVAELERKNENFHYIRNSPQFRNAILREQYVLDNIEPLLNEYPALKTLYLSIVNCEKKTCWKLKSF